MFSIKELVNYNCPMCEYCVYYNADGKRCEIKDSTCNFKPLDWNVYMKVLVNNLKLLDSNCVTTDKYHKQIVEDSLSLIRSGDVAYVFSLEQIRDILRHEPDIDVYYLPEYNTFSVKSSKE